MTSTSRNHSTTISSDTTLCSVRRLGRRLLCAAGASDDAAFRGRLRKVLSDCFKRDLGAMDHDSWEQVCGALDWAGAESGMWGDVVRICRALREIAPEVCCRIGLGLKASSLLEGMMGDEAGAFEELLQVNGLDPFSVELLDTVCTRVRSFDGAAQGGYWTRLADGYERLLTDGEDPRLDLAVLLIMAGLYGQEVGMERRVLKCLSHALRLDPGNDAVAARIDRIAAALRSRERPERAPIKDIRGAIRAWWDSMDESMIRSLAPPEEQLN